MKKIFFIKEEPEQINISLIFTSGSATKVYDGSPLTNSNVTTTIQSVSSNIRDINPTLIKVSGVIFNVTGSQTLAGYSANTFTADTSNIKIGYGNEDITSMCNIQTSNIFGNLTVINQEIDYGGP